jgi:hypothetical protein
MSTGVKLGEAQLLLAADMTASAFMRTDINLVQWMADVAGFHQFGGKFSALLLMPHVPAHHQPPSA